jgi:hypothetical protein
MNRVNRGVMDPLSLFAIFCLSLNKDYNANILFQSTLGEVLGKLLKAGKYKQVFVENSKI